MKWARGVRTGSLCFILQSSLSRLVSTVLLQPTFRRDCWKVVCCIPQHSSFQMAWGRSGIFPRFCLKLWVPVKTNALRKVWGVGCRWSHRRVRLWSCCSRSPSRLEPLGEVTRGSYGTSTWRFLTEVICRWTQCSWQHWCLQSREVGVEVGLCQVRSLASGDEGRAGQGTGVYLLSRWYSWSIGFPRTNGKESICLPCHTMTHP